MERIRVLYERKQFGLGFCRFGPSVDMGHGIQLRYWAGSFYPLSISIDLELFYNTKKTILFFFYCKFY